MCLINKDIEPGFIDFLHKHVKNKKKCKNRKWLDLHFSLITNKIKIKIKIELYFSNCIVFFQQQVTQDSTVLFLICYFAVVLHNIYIFFSDYIFKKVQIKHLNPIQWSHFYNIFTLKWDLKQLFVQSCQNFIGVCYGSLNWSKHDTAVVKSLCQTADSHCWEILSLKLKIICFLI